MPPRDPAHSVGFLMHEVSRLMRRDFNRRVQSLGLTQAQARAIAHLSRNEGINQAALAEILEIQPISLARLIDRLAGAGWVERRPDPRDRRAVQLHLTEKAGPILAEMWDLAAETRELAMAAIPEARRDALIATLQDMKRNLTEAEARQEGADAA